MEFQRKEQQRDQLRSAYSRWVATAEAVLLCIGKAPGSATQQQDRDEWRESRIEFASAVAALRLLERHPEWMRRVDQVSNAMSLGAWVPELLGGPLTDDKAIGLHIWMSSGYGKAVDAIIADIRTRHPELRIAPAVIR